MIHVTRNTRLPDEMTLVRIRSIASEVFFTREFSGDASLIFTNNKTIQKLNKEFRDIDAATDVLSFPSEEIDPESNVRYLGDVIISTERAILQSCPADKDYINELTMLIVHGCLHLTGLDHTTEAEELIMKTQQGLLLQTLGVDNLPWPKEE